MTLQLGLLFNLLWVVSATSFALTPAETCLTLLKELTPRWAPLEKIGPPETWKFDGHDGATYYDKDFAGLYEITGHKSIEEILQKRKFAGKANHVLDLFGSGLMVENQALATSVTGMRLGPLSRDSHDPFIRELFARLPPTPPEILGDATNLKTWEALRASMKERGIPSMNLVTMRPMGGWQQSPFSRTAEQNAVAIDLMVKNVLTVLSKDGQFYFSVNIPQLPGDLRENRILKRLVEEIEKETPYRLDLLTHISQINTTYELLGVLRPK